MTIIQRSGGGGGTEVILQLYHSMTVVACFARVDEMVGGWIEIRERREGTFSKEMPI
jgi:hypothetical protein